MAEKRKTGKKPGARKSKPAAKRKAAPGETPLEGAAAEAAPPGDAPPKEAQPADAQTADAQPGGVQADAAPPPRRLKREADFTTVAIWAVGVVAVLAGAGYATRPFWTPYVEAALSPLLGEVPPPSGQVPPPAADDQAIAALEAERTRFSARLNDLMRQVETLERSLADVRKMVAATNRPPADANQSLERLSQRLADLERTGSGREGLLRRLAKLEESVPGDRGEPAPAADAAPKGEPVSKEPADAMAKARATMEAVQRLRQVVGDSAPYAGELSALKDLAGTDADMSEAMAGLEPYQATGIPTLAALRARFDDVAGAMAAADRMRDGDDWTDRVLNRLASLVRVRRTGASAAEGTVDGAIAAAEDALRGGDLKAALEALDGLGGAAAEAAAEWVAGARARVTAERALATLHLHAVVLLAPARDN